MTYDNVPDLIKIVDESIEVSSRQASKIPHEVAQLRGMSSPKIRHFLNQVCSYGDCKYLEIGTYTGSTFIPALYDNQISGFYFDNWSQFTVEETGFDAREAFRENLKKYLPRLGQVGGYDGDCFAPGAEYGFGKRNVFFYDGQHESQPTQKAIEIYGKQCQQPFILLVDDWVLTPEVQAGTKKALESFNVHRFWELKKEDGHHEGVGIYVLEAK